MVHTYKDWLTSIPPEIIRKSTVALNELQKSINFIFFNNSKMSLKKSNKIDLAMDYKRKKSSEHTWQPEKGLVTSSGSLLFFIIIPIKRDRV